MEEWGNSYRPLSSDPVVTLAPFKVSASSLASKSGTKTDAAKTKGAARKAGAQSKAKAPSGTSRPSIMGATVITDPDAIAGILSSLGGGEIDLSALIEEQEK